MSKLNFCLFSVFILFNASMLLLAHELSPAPDSPRHGIGEKEGWMCPKCQHLVWCWIETCPFCGAKRATSE